MNTTADLHTCGADHQDRIAAIKAGVDCRALFKRLWPTHYRDHGNCVCPFHDDQDPSMQVTGRAAYCYAGCGPKDVIDLYSEATGATMTEALKELAKEPGLESDPRTGEEKQGGGEDSPDKRKALQDYSGPLTREARQYLESRGIVESIKRLEGEIGLAPANSNTGQDALAFPVTAWGHSNPLGFQFVPLDGSKKKNAPGTKVGDGFFQLDGEGPVVVTEGPIDALSVIEVIPNARACAILGAGATEKLKQLSHLEEPPILFFDRDKAGRDATARASEALNGHCRVVDWSLAPEGCKDPNDLVRAGHLQIMKAMIMNAQIAQQENSAPKPTGGFEGLTASELMQQEFPEQLWIVPGIIPEGLSVIAGRPKTGKSWMALNLSVATALGGCALGQLEVDEGRVLYLALEDSLRRFKDRPSKVLGDASPPENLHIFTSWPKMDAGGLDQLDRWCSEHPDTRLVIVDTLAKLWPNSKGGRGQTLYNTDYEATSSLKAVADKHGIAIITVHHLRKAVSEDPLEQISGSMGISGCADTLLILQKSRGRADATLLVTGRDVEEQELALNLDKNLMIWNLLGNAETYKRSEEQLELFEIVKGSAEPMTATEIVKLTGKSKQNIHKLLKALEKDGVISKDTTTKKYSLPGLLTLPGVLGLPGLPEDGEANIESSKPEHPHQEFTGNPHPARECGESKPGQPGQPPFCIRSDSAMEREQGYIQ
jgi:hypothetical protein